MPDYKIRDKCSVNTNYDADTFVGIKSDSDGISVHFPLGFRISDDDKILRKDILTLMSTIANTTARKDSETTEEAKQYNTTAFPLQDYLYVIYDYFSRGYYKEMEVIYTSGKQGKVNWGKTIKTKKPYVQDNNVFYLDLVVKKNSIKENELITLIHEYFVYESFDKIGWLFTALKPGQPRIKYNEKLFRGVLTDKIMHTFNDRNKKLFRSMLSIIDYQGDNEAPSKYRYGTYRFEYVWEAMIDKVFGITGKESYFPKTSWRIGDRKYDNACLEPDTIMICNGNVYVLDAKYYKYGYSHYVGDLPESTSINKQITYGEYIAENEKFKRIHGSNMTVYNAFILPYDSQNPIWKSQDNMYVVGEGVSNWKDNSREYHKIQGIMIDTRHLMSIAVKQDMKEIEKLASLIEKAVER